MSYDNLMLQREYGSLLAEVCRHRRDKLRKIEKRAKAEEYVGKVRKKIIRALGEFPEKTPLNAKITGTLEHDGLLIDRVLYESRPDFYVTALFYRPQNTVGKLPAVLAMCGHAQEGKLFGPYQTFAQALAKKGFAVLMFDPVAQGERLQFEKISNAEFCRNSCVYEHNQIGKQLLLFGENMANYMLWDAVRSLDYLCGRPEVDCKRLAVAGNSGGGTLSSYLWAFDDRLTAAAISCYMTTFERNFANELPVDAEQVLPGLAESGIEMADFLIARAPEPVLILGQQNDFFDVRGTLEAYDDVQKFYSLSGKAHQVNLFVGSQGHGLSPENREAIYGFLTGLLLGNVDSAEPEIKLLTSEMANVTKTGQTADLRNALTLPAMLAKRAGRQTKFDPGLMRRFLNQSFQLPAAFSEKIDYRVLRPWRRGEQWVSLFAVPTGKFAEAFLLLKGECYQLPCPVRARLTVAHLDAEAELTALTAGNDPNFVLDVRGIGKSMPGTCDRDLPGGFFAMYGSDYFYASAGVMLNHSLLGGKVRDVLTSAMLLRLRGVKELELAGNGLGGLAAALAAFLFPDWFSRVILTDVPESYLDLVQSKVSRIPQSYCPYGILTYGDLPDLYADLGKKLQKSGKWSLVV